MTRKIKVEKMLIRVLVHDEEIYRSLYCTRLSLQSHLQIGNELSGFFVVKMKMYRHQIRILFV